LGTGIVWHKRKVLIIQRPENGLLGGLWEFPSGRQQSDETLQVACARGVKESVGIDVQIQDRFRTVEHAFTHFSITIHSFQCRYSKGKIQLSSCDNFAWVSVAQLSDYALSRTSRKLADFLKESVPRDLFSA